MYASFSWLFVKRSYRHLEWTTLNMSHQPFGSGDHLCFGYRWPILLMWGDWPSGFLNLWYGRNAAAIKSIDLDCGDTSVHTEQDGKLRRCTWEAIPVCGQSAEQCFLTVCVVIYSHASSDFTPLSTPSWGTSCCEKSFWIRNLEMEMKWKWTLGFLRWLSILSFLD